ncbi:MAG: hypothetical protein ABIH00_09930 [Armatimonadota bacterium]
MDNTIIAQGATSTYYSRPSVEKKEQINYDLEGDKKATLVITKNIAVKTKEVKLTITLGSDKFNYIVKQTKDKKFKNPDIYFSKDAYTGTANRTGPASVCTYEQKSYRQVTAEEKEELITCLNCIISDKEKSEKHEEFLKAIQDGVKLLEPKEEEN